MKIGIIGGGFTGLSAAYELSKAGHQVTVFEKEKVLGGLAYGFKQPDWDWHLEYAYHHLFTNDDAIISLINELGLSDKLIIKRPVTANYLDNKIFQFDSPAHLLHFPGFSLIDKIRTAILLAFLKLNPLWQPLEYISAQALIKRVGGNTPWKLLWESLMVAKFGEYADKVAASWFWARIKKRTPSLCYIEGGFHTLVVAVEKAIKKNGGAILMDTSINRLIEVSSKKKFELEDSSGKRTVLDTVLLTTPTPIALKLLSHLPNTNPQPLTNIPHLHAQTLILETKEPILKDVYWLNVLDRSFPFLAVVAHTNFMDKKHYGGKHLTYFGNYLPIDHPYLAMKPEQLLKLFYPYIKRLCPTMNYKLITNHYIFVGPFAQPIHELHYSQKAPKLNPPAGGPGIYLANLDSIYPWDRGTNYAVELGQRAGNIIHNSQRASNTF